MTHDTVNAVQYTSHNYYSQQIYNVMKYHYTVNLIQQYTSHNSKPLNMMMINIYCNGTVFA